MREVNLAGLDLNLLPALEALLRLRNVTRAAAEVGMSQPAMSRALGRLRAQFGDPLLARGTRGLVVTPRGEALAALIAPAAAALKEVFRPPTFAPDTVRRTVRFAASDTHTILVAPILMAQLAKAAPGVDVQMEPYGPDLSAKLETGALDFAFAVSNTPLPPGAASMPLGRETLVLVMRKGHPLADRPATMADYVAYPHVTVALLGDGRSEIDAMLAGQGLARRIALVTPHFTAALATVAATNCLTTITRSFASRFAGMFELVLREPPFPAPPIEPVLVWAQVRSGDPFLAWMREQVRQAMQATL